MINIFFGSSILNEQGDKEQLEVFIRKLNVEFSTVNKLVDIHIKPLFKNELSVVENLIKKAEYTFFILFKSVTDDENDEIDLAVKSFEENNKPKVFVYFKILDENDSVEESIFKLQEKISNVFSHYYQTFKNIDEIKLRLIENVFSDKLKDSLVVSDDTLKFEGIDLGKYIDYKVMPEFVNNEELQSIKKEYDILLKEYNDAVISDNNDDFFYLEKLYAKKEILKEKLKDKEQKILSLSIKLIELKNKDLKNEAIEKAVKLFEKGDMKGCIEALNLSRTNRLIREAYSLKDKAMFELDQAKNNIIWAIKERRIVIDLLLATDNIENKDSMIEELFRENATMALDFEVEYDEAFNFGEFLTRHGKFDEALEFASMLEEVITEKSDRKYPILYAKLYNLFGLNSSFINKDENEAISYYIDSLKYYKMQEDELGSDEDYLYGLYKNNISIANSVMAANEKNNLQEAVSYYDEAIKICEKLCELNFTKYSVDLAFAYSRYIMLPSVKIDEKYGNFFLKYVDHAKNTNDGKNIEKIADATSQLGNYYFINGNHFTALNYFLEACSYYEKLKVISTNELRQKIGNTHNQIMTIKRALHEYKDAIYHQEKAKEYMSVAFKENPLFVTEYFTICFNLYMLYHDINPAKANKLLDECNKLIDTLYVAYPGRVDEIAAFLYGNIFVTFIESSELDKANVYYKKFKKIFDGLKAKGLDYSSFNIFYSLYADILFNVQVVNVEGLFESVKLMIDVAEYTLSLGDKNATTFIPYLNNINNFFNSIIMELQAIFMEHPEYVEIYQKYYEVMNKIIETGSDYTGNTENLEFMGQFNDIDNMSVEDVVSKMVEQNKINLSKEFENKLTEYDYKIKICHGFIIWATSTGVVDEEILKEFFDKAFELIFECNKEYPHVTIAEGTVIFSAFVEYYNVSRRNKEIVKQYIESEINKFTCDILHVPYTNLVITTILNALEDLYRIRDERENVVRYLGELYKVLNRITVEFDGLVNKKVEVKLLEFNASITDDFRYHQQIVDLLFDSVADSIDNELKISFNNSCVELFDALLDSENLDLLADYFEKLMEIINPIIESVNEINYESVVDLLEAIADIMEVFEIPEAVEFKEKAEELKEMFSSNDMDDFYNMFNM